MGKQYQVRNGVLVEITPKILARGGGGGAAIADMVRLSGQKFLRGELAVPDKTTITVKAPLYVMIGNACYGLEDDVVLDVSDVGDASARAGKDVYVYAVLSELEEGACELVLSMDPSAPTGHTTDDSRKVGGFHCLCLSVGTISGHPLSDYVTGDILPASVWDLKHRPTCQPEGMVYISELDFWADIYLQSGTGVNTKSVFGGTITASQTHGQHVEDLFKVGKAPLSDPEFSCAAEGSNQRTAIQGAANPETTGGHVDSGGRRMISNYGLEDCCGALWQWLDEQGPAGGSSWSSTDGGKGCVYGNVYALLAGGNRSNSTNCGSRCRHGSYSRLDASSVIGCRGRADNRVRY